MSQGELPEPWETNKMEKTRQDDGFWFVVLEPGTWCWELDRVRVRRYLMAGRHRGRGSAAMPLIGGKTQRR